MHLIRLFDLLLQEYFAITEHLIKNLNLTGDKAFLDSSVFYILLDRNLFIKRKDKLKLYRQLNFITCNNKGFTSVIYDKDLKTSKRKIILNLNTYRLLKKYYQIEIKI